MMKEKNKVVLGIDMGGTKIRVGKVEGSEVTATASNLIPASEDAETVLNTVKKTVATLFSDEVAGLGVGIPSVLDRKQGIVYDVQNIPSWKEVHLKKILEDEFNRVTCIDNDANCFAIGEKRYGKGRHYDHFVGITLGTGMGTGVINRGTLLCDANGGSGEFGEIPYLDSKLENYASGQFFKKAFNLDGKTIFERAKRGDSSALKAYEQFGIHLGNAVKIILYALDPGHVIFGGSIAAAKDYYETAMWKEIKTFAYPKSIDTLTIEYAELAENSPLLGAAAVYLDAAMCNETQ